MAEMVPSTSEPAAAPAPAGGLPLLAIVHKAVGVVQQSARWLQDTVAMMSEDEDVVASMEMSATGEKKKDGEITATDMYSPRSFERVSRFIDNAPAMADDTPLAFKIIRKHQEFGEKLSEKYEEPVTVTAHRNKHRKAITWRDRNGMSSAPNRAAPSMSAPRAIMAETERAAPAPESAGPMELAPAPAIAAASKAATSLRVEQATTASSAYGHDPIDGNQTPTKRSILSRFIPGRPSERTHGNTPRHAPGPTSVP
mmetsp:Transcript_32324/g.64476  ORF Transcript_32324/g.64476 Transcript_32324/m.64476 type:complete len:255 (-) Transcript_32324:284-1048(-)